MPRLERVLSVENQMTKPTTRVRSAVDISSMDCKRKKKRFRVERIPGSETRKAKNVRIALIVKATRWELETEIGFDEAKTLMSLLRRWARESRRLVATLSVFGICFISAYDLRA